jgi:hypothetical protein
MVRRDCVSEAALASEIRLHSYDKLLLAQQAIPDHDAVDRFIRSETASERSLIRALDRLNQLQRRRKEREAVEIADRR